MDYDRLRRNFRRASLVFVSVLAAGNFLPESCAKKVVVAPPILEPVPVSTLGRDVQRLNALHPEYNLSENGLVALTRMLYFEDWGDPLLHGDIEQAQGYAAIAEVIKNRHLFDLCAENASVKNPTCGRPKVDTLYDGDKGLAAIIEQNTVKKGRKIYQFTSQADFADYFHVDSLARGINYLIPKKDDKGKTVHVHAFDAKNIALAYETLVDVLEGKIAPLTEGALSYKNNNTSPNVWHDQEAMVVPSSDCSALEYGLEEKAQTEVEKGIQRGKVDCRIEQQYIHDYTKQIGSHHFYTMVEGDRSEVIFDNSRRKTYVNGSCTKGCK